MDVDHSDWLAGVFDRAAPAYDRVGTAYHDHFGQRLVDLAALPPRADLLDVGCGRGAVLVAAAGAGAASLTGVDVSAGMLHQAAQRGVDARLEVMDAERLAFADGSFDALTAAFLLFFLPDPERAAAEFHRVLRPGGRVAISTWGEEDPRWAWEDDLMADIRVARRAIRRPFDDPADVVALLTGAGFREVTPHRETLEIRFAGAEQWWDWHWSFSLRGVLEQLEAPALERLREAAVGRLRGADVPPMLLTAWIVTGST